MSHEGCEFLLHLDCGRINQPYLEDGEIMITFIAVVVSMNFLLLCLNEYSSLQRDKHLVEMIHRLESK